MIAPTLAIACRLMTGAVAEWRVDPHATTQRVYFGNHSSHLDFIVIWCALPPRLRGLTRPVAGGDYWCQGRVRRFLADRVFHAVLIDRQHAGATAGLAVARESLQHIVDGLGRQHSLIVFPEGTRSASGEIGAFKSGLFHLARARPDVQLVPVYLENLNRILPKGEWLPVPMLSRVVFGAPLEPHAHEDKAAFLARARAALVALKASR